MRGVGKVVGEGYGDVIVGVEGSMEGRLEPLGVGVRVAVGGVAFNCGREVIETKEDKYYLFVGKFD